MTAFQAPIFQSHELACKWVNLQSLDEEVMLCEVGRIYACSGEVFIQYEFHNHHSMYSMNNDNTVSKWTALEGWY